MLTVIILLLMGTNFELNPEKAGIYYSEGMPIYQLGENYVFLGFRDKVLALISPEGEVLKTYNKQGQGPGELEMSNPIGVSNDKYYLYTNDQILEFDNQLNFLKSHRLSSDSMLTSISSIFSGKKTKENRFILGCMFSPEVLIELVQGDSDWRVSSTVEIPEYFDLFMQKKNVTCGVSIRQDYIFINKIFTTETNYQIFGYQNDLPKTIDDESKAVIMLQADTGGFDIFEIGMRPVRTAIVRAFDTPEGFIVNFQHMSKDKNLTYYHDFFDKDGSFLERKKASGLHFLPCINASTVFALETDEDGNEKITIKYP